MSSTDTSVTPSKPFASSMTIQGLVVMAVSAFAPMLANLFHVQVGDINNVTSATITAVSAIAGLVGLVMGIVGRMRAVHVLT